MLEALRSSLPVSRVTFAAGLRPDRTLDEIERLAAEAGAVVTRSPREALDRRSERGGHQGVIAEVAPYVYAELDPVLTSAEGSATSLLVALDHVLDPGNLGAVARSAEVAGAGALIVPRRRSAPVTAAAHKAAAGALAYLPVVRVTNLARALKEVKRHGYWVAGASQDAERTVWESPMEGRLCIVLGGEGTGLSRLVEETCDFTVRLPVAGRVDSLNVAQAATALAFEWVRRTAQGS